MEMALDAPATPTDTLPTGPLTVAVALPIVVVCANEAPQIAAVAEPLVGDWDKYAFDESGRLVVPTVLDTGIDTVP